MKKFLFIFILLICTEMLAQSNHDNYIILRNKGIASMKSGKYADAMFKFEGAEGFADNNEKEITALKNQLKDSINNTFAKAKKLRQEGGKRNLELAIIEFEKLVDTNIKYVYSYIGLCYESIPNIELAKFYYKNGTEKNDDFAAYKLAVILRKTYSTVQNDSIIHLYERASDYSYANDSLGSEYERIHLIPKAFKCYEKSGSDFGKYQMARLLIDNTNLGKDDPITILNKLSKNNYSEACYLLGTLYYSGEQVSKDEKEGILLIEKAANGGCIHAKQWLKNKNIESNEPSMPVVAESRVVTVPTYSNEKTNSWSKIDRDESSWGIAYNYSKSFPITLSANYTISYFSIGAEIGLNLSKNEYRISENKIGDPRCYLAISPGFYDRYFSINFGLGLLRDCRTESSSISTGSTYAFASISEDKYSLLLKPSITGYIPICDGDYCITVNAGYYVMPQFKKLNTLSIGIGFQMQLDN